MDYTFSLSSLTYEEKQSLIHDYIATSETTGYVMDDDMNEIKAIVNNNKDVTSSAFETIFPKLLSDEEETLLKNALSGLSGKYVDEAGEIKLDISFDKIKGEVIDNPKLSALITYLSSIISGNSENIEGLSVSTTFDGNILSTILFEKDDIKNVASADLSDLRPTVDLHINDAEMEGTVLKLTLEGIDAPNNIVSTDLKLLFNDVNANINELSAILNGFSSNYNVRFHTDIMRAETKAISSVLSGYTTECAVSAAISGLSNAITNIDTRIEKITIDAGMSMKSFNIFDIVNPTKLDDANKLNTYNALLSSTCELTGDLVAGATIAPSSFVLDVVSSFNAGIPVVVNVDDYMLQVTEVLTSDYTYYTGTPVAAYTSGFMCVGRIADPLSLKTENAIGLATYSMLISGTHVWSNFNVEAKSILNIASGYIDELSSKFTTAIGYINAAVQNIAASAIQMSGIVQAGFNNFATSATTLATNVATLSAKTNAIEQQLGRLALSTTQLSTAIDNNLKRANDYTDEVSSMLSSIFDSKLLAGINEATGYTDMVSTLLSTIITEYIEERLKKEGPDYDSYLKVTSLESPNAIGFNSSNASGIMYSYDCVNWQQFISGQMISIRTNMPLYLTSTLDQANSIGMVSENSIMLDGNIYSLVDNDGIGTEDHGLFSFAFTNNLGMNSSTNYADSDLHLVNLDLSKTIRPFIVSNNLFWGGGTGKHDRNLKTIIFPSSTIRICKHAFRLCEALSAVDLGYCNSLSAIDEIAFGSCKSIESMILPSSLTTIGTDAFNTISACYISAYQGCMGWNTDADINNATSGITKYGAVTGPNLSAHIIERERN